jgi:hypothetical protein
LLFLFLDWRALSIDIESLCVPHEKLDFGLPAENYQHFNQYDFSKYLDLRGQILQQSNCRRFGELVSFMVSL